MGSLKRGCQPKTHDQGIWWVLCLFLAGTLGAITVSRLSTHCVAVVVMLAIVAVGCHTKPDYEQVDSRRVWNEELSSGTYESHVDASTKKEGSTVVVTCTLPEIQSGSIRYEVDQIVLRDAEQKDLVALEKKPTFRVALPEQQLKDVVVNVLYMDERAFSEIITDPDLVPDWCVLVKKFQLIDVLKAH